MFEPQQHAVEGLGEAGREPQPDRARLAVDDDAVPAGRGQQGGSPVRIPDRVGAAGRPAVGDQDEQRAAAGVADAFGAEHLVRAKQTGRERGAPAGRQRGQPGRRGLDRERRRQREIGRAAPERDHADLVPALVGVEQQGQHRALHRAHPGPGRHRTAGVHHEQDQVGFPALVAGLAQVAGAQQQPARRGPAPCDLVRRGRGERGGHMYPADPAPRLARPGDVPGIRPSPGPAARCPRAGAGNFEAPDPEHRSRGSRCPRRGNPGP